MSRTEKLDHYELRVQRDESFTAAEMEDVLHYIKILEEAVERADYATQVSRRRLAKPEIT